MHVHIRSRSAKLVKANEAVDRGNTPDALSPAQQASTLPRRSSYVLAQAIAANHLIAMVDKRPTNAGAESYRMPGSPLLFLGS